MALARLSTKRAGPKSAKALEKALMARRAIQQRAGVAHGYNPNRDARGRFAPGPHKAKGTEKHAAAAVGAFARARKLAAAKGAVKAAAAPAVKAHEAVRAKIEHARRVKDPFYIKSLAEATPEKIAKIAKRKGKKEGEPAPMVAAVTAARRKAQAKVKLPVKAEVSAKPAVAAAMKARKAMVKRYTEASKSEPAKWARKMREQQVKLGAEVDRLADEKAAAKTAVKNMSVSLNAKQKKAIYDRHDELVKQHNSAISKLYAINDWFKARKDVPHLIPPLEIKSRLKLYKAGDEKVKALQSLHRDKPEWTPEHQKEWESSASKIISGKTPKEREAAAARFNELNKLNARSLGGIDEEARSAAHKLLNLDPSHTSSFAISGLPKTGDPTVEITGRVQSRVNEAFDWLGAKVFKGGLEQKVPTGMLDPGQSDVHHNRASGGANGIRISSDNAPSVVVHEMGHYIEGQTSAGAAARAFLAHRVGDEQLKPMTSFEGGDGYGKGEEGRKDKFDRFFENESHAAYVGKHYSSGVTEIMSMGMEALHRDPVGFARKDPEFCKFILGLMDGSLR